MSSEINSKIENIYKIHQERGFGGVVNFWLDHILEVLKKFPNKPSPLDKECIKEFNFVSAFVFSKDEKWLTPFNKVSINWLESGICDICFSDLLHEYYDYLNPEQDIALSSKDLAKIVKFFKENFHYETKEFFYQKYELKDNEFIIADPKFKQARSRDSDNKNDNEESRNNTIKSGKRQKKTELKNAGVVGGVLWEFLKNNENSESL